MNHTFLKIAPIWDLNLYLIDFFFFIRSMQDDLYQFHRENVQIGLLFETQDYMGASSFKGICCNLYTQN